MKTLKENIESIISQIGEAAKFAGRRPEDVKLIAVTKNIPIQTILDAYNLGIKRFGENKIQELEKKKNLLPAEIEWHMIGHLQSNKAIKAIKYASLIHSVDSLSLLERLDRLAGTEKTKVNILIEMNISGEESKYGLRTEDELKYLCEKTLNAKNVNFLGLMTMAPFGADEDKLRKIFSTLRLFAENLEKEFHLKNLELSMGMSADFQIAVQEGSTMVRIGTAIFANS